MPSPTIIWIGDSLGELAVPVAVVLGVGLALLLARRYLLRVLERLVGRTKTGWPELLASSLRTPTLLWCVAIGLAAGLEAAPVPGRLAAWGTSLMAVLVVLSITLVAANAGTKYLQHIAEREKIDAALTGVGTTLCRVLIYILGGLVGLSTLGIAITPLVATLGVGGIAVALAMQDILSNLFAGIYIVAEKPVRVGNIVKLESGQEGTVMDIGWRTTRIRMPPNHTVIVPNSKLIQSVLTLQDPQPAPPAAVPAGAGSQRGSGGGPWGC